MTNERVIGLSLSHLKSPESVDEALQGTLEPKSERELAIGFRPNGLSTASLRLIAPGSRLVGFGPIYLFQNVPAKVCTACGEIWIDEEVLQQIDKLIEYGVPVRKVETPVYDFPRAIAPAH